MRLAVLLPRRTNPLQNRVYFYRKECAFLGAKGDIILKRQHENGRVTALQKER